MLKYIDTHSHIYTEDFDNDIDDVISRAINTGVSKIVLPNTDINSIERLNSITKKYPDILLPVMGIHPTDIHEDYKQKLEIIRNTALSGKYYGIGETGIDLYHDRSFIKEQIESLIFHVELASELDLPLVIHTRESFEITMKTIRENKRSNTRGVFHCFVGDNTMADEIIKTNFLLGIGGVVTFKNSDLKNTLQSIDIANIVVETDAPYLSPVPHRGKRNEPSYIPYIAEKLSSIYNISIEEVARITTKNGERLFNI